MPATPILGLPYPTSADTSDVPRDVKALADALDPLGVVPVGALMLWPTALAPAAWLICDGHAVLAADYPKLVAVLGAVGGQITLPDLRNRVPIGPGENPLLGQGGAKEVTLAAAQIPAHVHNVAGFNTANGGTHTHQVAAQATGIENGDHSHSVHITTFSYTPGASQANFVTVYGSGSFILTPGTSGRSSSHAHNVPSHLTAADGDHTHVVAARDTSSIGGGLPHSIEQRFLVVNFIIRAL